MTYADKLKHPNWQKKRLEILQRDNFCCRLCSDTETNLQVHHKQYIDGREPWEYPNEDLITYCEPCHHLVEYLKKETTYIPLAVAKIASTILNYSFVVVQDTQPIDADNEIIVLAINRNPLNKKWVILLSVNKKNIIGLGEIIDSALKLKNG